MLVVEVVLVVIDVVVVVDELVVVVLSVVVEVVLVVVEVAGASVVVLAGVTGEVQAPSTTMPTATSRARPKCRRTSGRPWSLLGALRSSGAFVGTDPIGRPLTPPDDPGRG